MTEKTSHYPAVDANPEFSAIETRVLERWQQEDTFRQSVDNRDGSKDYIFYDGPPFANGLPHYGHLLTGYVKDLFARYHTMKGERVERRFGWDCHGLPAEMGAEKELGVSGRANIERYGIQKFNDYCRTSVMKYTQEWEDYVTRQARWVDFENDYKTMDTPYMESVMWAFSELYKKGLVYESHRVMPYSWAMETPVSNFETRMDNSYREREDKAITVAFKLREKPKGAPAAEEYYVLAWTTTPWTLPSNLALAVKADMGYSAIALKDRSKCLILNSSMFPLYVKELDLGFPYELLNAELSDSELEQGMNDLADRHARIIPGKDLIGLTYEPLFPYFASHPNSFRILDGSDFIEEGSGTGVVHMAPGFGEDDQRVCAANGIDLVVPVDERGCYTDAIFEIPSSQQNKPSPSGRGQGEGIHKTDQARALRKDSTEAESKLWSALRNRNLESHKFRRQETIGNYIVDFACWEKRLVVEIDGSQHMEQAEYDATRTAWLESQGFRVLRFWNNEVLQNIEGVAEKILQALQQNPHPGPLPEGEGVIHPGLALAGLNVVADTRKNADEPYTDKQLAQYGLANLRIITYLKGTGRLIKQEDYRHSYPHCWRTDTPLIYRALPSWYVEVSKFAPRMVELNEQINWIPDHIKHGRFGKWLEGARDWSISRNRYWGSPIPVWKNDKDEEVKVFGSIKELEAFFNVEVKDLHRPFIDELVKEEGGKTWRRVTDVFDCWFESGSMPYAQVHYPFENKDWFETHFPADFIVEYEAQTRGWFYTLMVLSTALFDKPPFKNCICHGVVMSNEKDENGHYHKLSKRLRNYPDPMDVFGTYGADALRWFMMSSPVMRGSEMYIDKEGKFIRDSVRLYLKPIWNAYNFFTLYANADGVKAELDYSSKNVMDKYIISKLAETVYHIEQALDAYDTPKACQVVTEFFEALNNWYIRRNKERFWSKEHNADKQAAYNTLYSILHVISRAISPLLPLISDEIYQGLTGERSVHLADFPKHGEIANHAEVNKLYSSTGDLDSNLSNEMLVELMDYARDICNTGLALRAKHNFRVRLPLPKLTLVGAAAKSAMPFMKIIQDELNIKQIVADPDIGKFASYKMQVNLPVVGKKLGPAVKDVMNAARNGQWTKNADGSLTLAGVTLQPGEYTIMLEPKPEYKNSAQALSSNDALVILDLTVTPELEAEGIARDVVRMVQQSRKDADLDVSAHIDLTLELSPAHAEAVRTHAGYIREQVLANNLHIGSVTAAEHRFENTLDEQKVVIAFSPVKIAA